MFVPRLSISESTTWTLTFGRGLEAHRKAGCEGLGIWKFKLAAGRESSAMERLQRGGLIASLCLPGVPYLLPTPHFLDPKDQKSASRRHRHLFAVWPASKPTACICARGPSRASMNFLRGSWRDSLGIATDVAGKAGVTLASE